MSEQRSSNPCDALLSDMRRKYLHARPLEADPEWLKGDPLSASILERWIPQVEALQQEINRLRLIISGKTFHEPTAHEPTAGDLAIGIDWLKREIEDGDEYLKSNPDSVGELNQQVERKRLLSAIGRTTPPPSAVEFFDLNRAKALADAVVLRVCELPDRNSPEDEPDLLIASPDELHTAVVAELENEFEHRTGRSCLELAPSVTKEESR